MKGVIKFLCIPFTVILMCSHFAYADIQWPEGCQISYLPSNDTKYPEDQIVLTCIPDVWNGNLVVYAHGYISIQESLALPEDELTLPSGQTIPEIVMSLGFAFATSSYHKNGYAVEQAGNDLNDLVDYFTTYVAPHPVQKVYITGASEGGLIATMLLEQYPEMYEGGLALCGPVGGAPYQIKYLGDFRVVFDYLFPWVFSDFGVADVPDYAYQDWGSIYVPAITSAIGSNPHLTKQLFRVTGAARDPGNPASSIETTLSVLFYSIWGTNDLIDVAGGFPYGNLLTWYHGSYNDLALNGGVERVKSDGAARTYLHNYYQPNGNLKRPLVTLHNTLDGVVPFKHELKYLGRTILAGKSRYLTVLPVPRYGHCNFTTEEILGAFTIMLLKSKIQ